MSRTDPIRDNYFDKLQAADVVGNWLFVAGALLSLGGLFVSPERWPLTYTLVQVTFMLVAVGLFTLGLASRLYFFPRAENKRRQDFFGHVYNVPLTHQATDGYYNNTETDPVRRMA